MTVDPKGELTVDEYFAGQEEARRIFEALRREIEGLGAVEVRVTKSQVAFRRRRAFAWAWRPGKYLRGECAPLVLTVALHYRDPSSRWKEIVEPKPGRFTHHLELYAVEEIDEDVQVWLEQAWLGAE
jgi:dihydroneopterin aldolase